MTKKCTWGILIASLLLAGMAFATLLAVPVRAQDTSGITSPGPGAAINGDVPIYGTATIDPFQKYELHYKQEPSGDDAYIYFAGGTSPVINGQLGVWQAGALPPGTYTIRLRVVKADGNYAEFFTPNVSVNQALSAPTATATEAITETPTATPTFTPAPQPTAVVGQVTQPQVEGDTPPTATPAPAAAAAVEPGTSNPAAAGGALLPTATPVGGPSVTADGGGNVTQQLGAELGFERLRTQFLNGMRISASLFIAFGALLAGKRLFEWVRKNYG